MSAKRREPAHDRETEPHAAPPGMVSGRRGQLHELVEDARAVVFGDADARVDHVDAHRSCAPARPDDDATRRRVTHRVGHEIAQDAFEQDRIGVDRKPRRHDPQRKSRRVRLRREIGGEARQQRSERHARPCRLERSGVQPRQVEQLGEQFLEGFDRRANARDQRSHLGIAHPGRERGGKESHRMQRLAQVMARRGEKLALGPAGRLGGGARGERGLRLCLEFADEVDVFIAHRQRLGQHAVHLAAERQHEHQHDAEHARREQMHLVAFDGNPRDQRHERGEHEAVERRLVDGGEVEPAEDHAELADDEQRLVRG